MRLFSILLVVLVSLFSCEKSQDEDEIRIIPGLKPEEILDYLNDAYEAESKAKLKNLLDYWHMENACVRSSEIKNDTFKNIYEAFKAFYSPFDIGRLGEHEWGSEIYQGVNFIIIQNKLYYDFNYDLSVDSPKDSIIDFRPDVIFGSAVKNLYLTLPYEIALNAFLGSDHYPLGTYGIMNPAVPSEESAKRQQFLNQYLRIFHGHWGGYWHLETHPEVSTMHFDIYMNKARFHFRVVYMFGEAFLEKRNNQWELVSSSITMIE